MQPPRFELHESSNQFQPPVQQQANLNPFLVKQPPINSDARGMPHNPIAGGPIGQSKLESSFPSRPPPPPYSSSSGGVSNDPLHLSSLVTAPPRQQMSGYNPRTQTVPLGQGANGVSSSTALHLKALPDQFNDEALLMNHFSKFGHVTRIKCNTAKMYATVTFKTHVSSSQVYLHTWRVLPRGCGGIA